MTQRVLLLISITLVLLSCDKKQSELEFEQSVLYEIFPALMGAIDFDIWLLPPPPPPTGSAVREKGEVVGADNTGSEEELFDYSRWYEEQIANFKADSLDIVIAIRDFVFPLESDHKNHLLEHFRRHNLILDSADLSTEYKIDLGKLITDTNVRLKYRSDFPKGHDIWKNDYDFHFSGILSLTRIQFDATKAYGVFAGGMLNGPLVGIGFRVFIKKVNGKWIIDKIEETTVS